MKHGVFSEFNNQVLTKVKESGLRAAVNPTKEVNNVYPPFRSCNSGAGCGAAGFGR
jgi:hypothetical protein